MCKTEENFFDETNYKIGKEIMKTVSYTNTNIGLSGKSFTLDFNWLFAKDNNVTLENNILTKSL